MRARLLAFIVVLAIGHVLPVASAAQLVHFCDGPRPVCEAQEDAFFLADETGLTNPGQLVGNAKGNTIEEASGMAPPAEEVVALAATVPRAINLSWVAVAQPDPPPRPLSPPLESQGARPPELPLTEVKVPTVEAAPPLAPASEPLALEWEEDNLSAHPIPEPGPLPRDVIVPADEEAHYRRPAILDTPPETTVALLQEKVETPQGPGSSSLVETASVQTEANPALSSVSPALIFATVLLLGALLHLLPQALYHEVERSRFLENELRRATLQHVRERPGATTAEIARSLGIAYNTARHHLEVLERFDAVVRRARGAQLCFFENRGGLAPESERDALMAASSGNVRFLEVVSARTTPSQKEVAAALNLAPSTVSWRVDRLAALGLLVREGAGLRVTTEGMRTLGYPPPFTPTGGAAAGNSS